MQRIEVKASRLRAYALRRGGLPPTRGARGLGCFFRLAGVPRLRRSTACLTADARSTGLKFGGHSPAGFALQIPIYPLDVYNNVCNFNEYIYQQI